MVLTRRFSRGVLFIAFAASFGMFAQEMVSRILLAGDQPSTLASASSRSWRSAESFYLGHPGIFRAEDVSPSEPVTGDLVESALVEPAIEQFVAQTVVQPETTSMEEPVSVMVQSPYESWWAATNGSDRCSTDESTVPDTHQFAVLDKPPPVTERRPDSIPSPAPTASAELPPPEVRMPNLEPADPEQLQPPRPQGRVRGRKDLAKSAPDYPLLQNSVPPARSDSLYADPAELVRQRGIERGQQLQRRIEAQRLFGYHPSRPPVQASPFTTADQFRPVVIVVPRTVIVQER